MILGGTEVHPLHISPWKQTSMDNSDESGYNSYKICQLSNNTCCLHKNLAQEINNKCTHPVKKLSYQHLYLPDRNDGTA